MASTIYLLYELEAAEALGIREFAYACSMADGPGGTAEVRTKRGAYGERQVKTPPMSDGWKKGSLSVLMRKRGSMVRKRVVRRF